jgi:acetylornithine/N-succinyldiaminopimelate aminotransferase
MSLTRAGAASALLGVYRPAAPVFVAGRGCRLIDDAGREYLDFAAGIAVNALGYGDAGIRSAVGRALEAGLVHTSNLFQTEPAERLAAELTARSFADRVFFCNSGAEANEGAIKFARRWARGAGGAGKYEVVGLRGSFHGRLMGTLAVTDRPAFREPFEPVMPGARIIDPDDEAAVAAAIDPGRTAAVLVEPVQGEGGVRPLPAETLRRLRERADAAGALLIFDEVQCGLGRTGRLFAYEAAGVVPDMLTLAKPLAGGLPMGAILLSERVAAAIQPGDHATTFGGGPLVATVALEVLERVAQPSFLAHVREMGRHLEAIVRGWNGLGVRDVRGRGLMWGLVLDRPAAPVVDAALGAGLLVITAGERVIRLLPPLVIGREELEDGLNRLHGALQ